MPHPGRKGYTHKQRVLAVACYFAGLPLKRAALAAGFGCSGDAVHVWATNHADVAIEAARIVDRAKAMYSVSTVSQTSPRKRNVAEYDGRKKAVRMYELDGTFVAEFPTINSAAVAVNGSRISISKHLRGKLPTAYNKLFTYKGAPPPKPLKHEVITQKRVYSTESYARMQENGRRAAAARWGKTYTTPIFQYTLRGEKVASFDSVASAAASTGLNAGKISDRLSGRKRSYHKFVWSRGPIGSTFFDDHVVSTSGRLYTKEAYEKLRERGRVMRAALSPEDVARFLAIAHAARRSNG